MGNVAKRKIDHIDNVFKYKMNKIKNIFETKNININQVYLHIRSCVFLATLQL